MKNIRLLVTFLMVALFLLSISFVPISANETVYYTTSEGVQYSLASFDIYIEDFQNVNFQTSQDVIDYIYEIGYRRTLTRDGNQYTIFGKTLTEDELALVVQHPIYASKAYECSQEAVSAAATYYSSCHGDGELGNAFQHAYWVMLMYYRTSPSFALDFSTAHENYNGNPVLHKTMDLYNNSAAYDYCEGLNNSSSSPSDATIRNYVFSMMNTGELDYIIFNYQYVRSIIYYDDTGDVEEIMDTADLYAHTNSTVPYNIPDPIIRHIANTPGLMSID